MEVDFNDENLRDLCASERDLTRRYGPRMAQRVAQRLQQLRVADNLSDVQSMGGRCHPLRGNYAGCYALDLVHPLRLIFSPANGEFDPGHGWQLESVTAITVVEIVDYH